MKIKSFIKNSNNLVDEISKSYDSWIINTGLLHTDESELVEALRVAENFARSMRRRAEYLLNKGENIKENIIKTTGEKSK